MRTRTAISILSGFALAFGIASARADTILWISDSNDNIGQVDINTQSVVPGSVHNTGQPLTDIGFDTNGNLYGTTFTGLFAINPNTGAATSHGTYSGETGMNALVGSSTSGTLIGGSYLNGNIYAINESNAALSVVKTVSAPGLAGDFASFGSTLYASACSAPQACVSSPTAPDELANVNTGTVVGLFHVGSPTGPTLNQVYGLAYDGTTMYAIDGTEVYSVDPATAVLTPLFDYSLHENGQNLTAASGAAFDGEMEPIPTPTSVPEPASLGIFAAALAGLGFVRRGRRNA
jgi:hypothetical protein